MSRGVEIAMSKGYKIEHLIHTSSEITIVWDDGHESVFPSIWLLHACSCDRCGTSETGVRSVRLTEQPTRPDIVDASISTNGIAIDWGGNHRSEFEAIWLRGHCLSDKERRKRKPAPRPWGEELSNDLPYMDYNTVSSDPDAHLEFLETLRDKGVVLLRSVPPERERTEEIAGLVGKLRMTNYGIFELEAKPNPEISGDMAVALELHSDEPYRIEMPGITFFHVLQQSDAGGDSTMADGIWLAKTLKEREPEAYGILSNVPARHNRTLQEGRAFDVQAPVFSHDYLGQVTGIRVNDRGMAPVDCAVEMVEPFYDALRKLLTLIYSGEGRVTVKLQPGEMMVFNNQRLLHGREAFDPSRSHRHVRSCHVDLDEFHSRLRVAYHERGRVEAWMNLNANAPT